MDAELVNAPALLHHPDLALRLAAGFVAGALAGLVYFRALWWNVRLFLAAGPAAWAVALLAARLAVVVGLLLVAALHGAPTLLATAAGVLAARAGALRRLPGEPR